MPPASDDLISYHSPLATLVVVVACLQKATFFTVTELIYVQRPSVVAGAVTGPPSEAFRMETDHDTTATGDTHDALHDGVVPTRTCTYTVEDQRCCPGSDVHRSTVTGSPLIVQHLFLDHR